MRRSCPKCKNILRWRDLTRLVFGLRGSCQECGVLLRISSLWMCLLSMFAAFVAVASLGFVNLLGLKGFFLAAATPILFFFIGSHFLPLRVKK